MQDELVWNFNTELDMEPDVNKKAVMAAHAPTTVMEATTNWAEYARVVSLAQGYQLDAAQLERVTAQLELISAVAAPLLTMQLPAELEPAPVFRP